MSDFAEVIRSGSREEELLRSIDLKRLPIHVAVIMDGNGRWARKRLLPRVAGHRAGVEAVRSTVDTAARLGIKVLTLYAFSVENWKRPAYEIEALMTFLKEYLRKEIDNLDRNNIRFQTIGRTDELEESVRRELASARAQTCDNTGMILNVALNYSGRAELIDAVKNILSEGMPAERITDAEISKHLYTGDLPDPDLMIRTSGEMRISNFLLWQLAYSEIYITETLWPDFRRPHLFEAIIDFQKRERRYGGLVDSPEKLAVNAN